MTGEIQLAKTALIIVGAVLLIAMIVFLYLLAAGQMKAGEKIDIKIGRTKRNDNHKDTF